MPNIDTLVKQENPYGEGLHFLLEIEMLQNPAVANALILNIFRVSSRIKDTEILTDSNNKRMLVWIKLDWLGRKFFTESIKKNIVSMLTTALPAFQFRVVEDRVIFDKSLNLMSKKSNDQKTTTSQSK